VPPPLRVAFAGGAHGAWRVASIAAVAGPALARVERVAVIEGGGAAPPPGAAWVLRGVTSNARYTTRVEQAALAAVQPPLGRPDATRAALIPVRKSEAWWALAQDERRAILEERSHHIALGRGHVPAVARRLHHGRDLGEPFDFVTWFEYAPAHAAAFEELVAALRATEEWRYVEREVDVRLERAAGSSRSEPTTASAAPSSAAA
jgi:Chlorite dismutase